MAQLLRVGRSRATEVMDLSDVPADAAVAAAPWIAEGWSSIQSD